MKDFNDLWLVSQGRAPVEHDDLVEGVAAIFFDRDYELPLSAPAALSDEFARDRQEDWTAWVRDARRTGRVPDDLRDVVAGIRPWACRLFIEARASAAVDHAPAPAPRRF